MLLWPCSLEIIRLLVDHCSWVYIHHGWFQLSQATLIQFIVSSNTRAHLICFATTRCRYEKLTGSLMTLTHRCDAHIVFINQSIVNHHSLVILHTLWVVIQVRVEIPVLISALADIVQDLGADLSSVKLDPWATPRVAALILRDGFLDLRELRHY